MFDSITIANDDGDDCENAQISQADYDKIAGYDGDTSSISDEDLVKYYEDMLQNTPMVSGPVDSDTPSMTYAQGLDILSDLKGLKTQSAENRKNDLQNEIDELIEKDSSISAETKQKYKDMQKALKELKSGLEERKRQLETNKRNTQILEAKIASKRAKADNIEDENDKANLEEEITSLNEDMSAFETDAKNLQTDITHFKSDITRLTKDLEKIMKEIEKSSAETARKIAEKQAEMDRVDQELAQDIANIDEQMEKAQKQLILEAQRAGTDSANYAKPLRHYQMQQVKLVSEKQQGATTEQLLLSTEVALIMVLHGAQALFLGVTKAMMYLDIKHQSVESRWQHKDKVYIQKKGHIPQNRVML